MPTKRQRKVTVSKLFQSVIHSALVSAASIGMRGKRCRMSEIRFYVDLFSGLLLMGSSKETVVIQSVQIMRILEGLEADGLALIQKEGSHTYYELLPSGSLFLLSEMVNVEQRLPIEDTLFINYFVTTYRPQLLLLLDFLKTDEEKAQMTQVLEPGRVLTRQLAVLDEILHKLSGRQADYAKIAAFLSNPAIAKLSLEQKIQQLPLGPSIPQTYKRTIREVLADLPANVREQEIHQGFAKRHQFFIAPYFRMLSDERALLASLLPASTQV